MFDKISHYARVLTSSIREYGKNSLRSSQWKSTRRDFLKKSQNFCAACWYLDNLQVHHKEPFNERPDLELDESNLITLCMGPNECHLKIGHGGSFDYFNPNVEEDAETVSKSLDRMEEITKKALESRLINKPNKPNK